MTESAAGDRSIMRMLRDSAEYAADPRAEREAMPDDSTAHSRPRRPPSPAGRIPAGAARFSVRLATGGHWCAPYRRRERLRPRTRANNQASEQVGSARQARYG